MTLELAVLILTCGVTICGGIGLAALLAWNPERRPLHLWLACGGVSLAVWAYFVLALHVPALSPTTRAAAAMLVMSAQVIAPVMLYAFVRRLLPPVDIYARGVVIWARVFVVAALLIIWAGGAAHSPADWGDHALDWRPLGVIIVVQAAIFALIPFLLLRLKTGLDAGLLGPAGLALALGLLASLLPGLRGSPLDMALVAAATTFAGYTLVRGQLFAPLLAESAALREEVRALRASMTDLAADKEQAEQLSEELREANRAKNEFLTNMSHALRTPLNSIVGYSELLLKGIYGDLNERQSDRADKILRNSQRLLALLNDSLDLTRIEGGRLELDLQPLQMSRVIAAARDEAAQRAGAAAGGSPAAVEVDLAGPLRVVRGDEERVRQVIAALLIHAMQRVPGGVAKLHARNVTVRDGRTEDAALPTLGWLEDRHWLLVSVHDDGPAIPPEEQALIFEAFRQAGDPARQEGEGGIGLGLVVAKRLVELHAGRLWVRSGPDVGTTFFVALPAQASFEPGEL